MNGILLNVVLMVRKFYKHDKIIDIAFTLSCLYTHKFIIAFILSVVLINYYNCNLIIWDELIIYNNKLI